MNDGQLLTMCLIAAAFLMNYKRIMNWACNTNSNNEDNNK